MSQKDANFTNIAVPTSAKADPTSAPKERILHLLNDRGSAAAIEFAVSHADVAQAVGALDEAMRDFYWKKKDLPSSVTLSLAAARHALNSADAVSTTEPELATKLRGLAKTLYYNLASFTWRGWDEKDIAITASDETIGLEAARENLRLGIELEKGDLPLSRAHWMLGAQQISASEYAAAIDSFNIATGRAHAANEPGDELLGNAFAGLTEYLAHQDDAQFDRLLTTIGELTKVKDGEFFAGQVATAMKVYCPTCNRLEELNAATAAKAGAV